MKNKKSIIILVLLLVISVGYAALSSNLKINGATGVKSASWIIHWANPQVVPGSVTTTKPTLSESNTNATWSVTLTEPGDFYEFTIDAVNEGTLDAEILQIKSKFNDKDGEDIITEGPNRNLPAYIEYEVTHADNEHSPITVGESLDHGQTETYRVRVAYSENINPSDLEETDITTKFYFEIEYKQKEKTNSGEEPDGDSPIKIVNRQVPDEITPGDEVVIEEDDDDDTSQGFIVSKVDGNSVYLLAKYNLSTFATTLNSTPFYQYDDTPYVEVYDDATGDYINLDGIYPYHDEVPFAKSEYWSGKVGTDYTSDNYYDSTYTGTPSYTTTFTCAFDDITHADDYCTYSSEYGIEGDIRFALDENNTQNNYSLAYYVENYKNILVAKGARIQDIRIPKESDVSAIVNAGLLEYSGSRSFWLANLKYVRNINNIDPEWEPNPERIMTSSLKSRMYYTNEYYYNTNGVRPLIIVNASDIRD